MGLQNISIADGVRLHCLPTGKFKTNFMSVSFTAPLEAGVNAMNSLIPNILLRGSEKYPDMAAINRRLDYLYAAGISTRCSKRGDVQVFGLCADMLDSSYAIGGEDLVAEMTDMLGELLLHPIKVGEGFDPDYTESEKNNQIDAIRASINNKVYYAYRRCVEEMCRGERFGLTETGTVDETSACTPESLYSQYKYALKHYPIEIFFVGQCDADALADRLRSIFSFEREPIALPATEVIRSAAEPKTVTEDMPVNQGKLVIGMRSGLTLADPEYPALMLCNAIYGGAVTSKLFMNVREKMSLCYYCQSSPDAAKGLLMIQSGIEVSNREVAEKAILEQLEAVRRGDFTDEEMNGALLFLINSYNELADSARGLENWYLGRMIFNIPGEPDEMVERLRAVTREDIIAAAKLPTLDTVYFLNGTLCGEDEEDENA